MPLKQGKTKKAFESNLKTELHEGKPKDQALAIAYSIQRKNKHKMANGGMISHENNQDITEHYESIADAILAKKRKNKMAEGGMVDEDRDSTLMDNATEHENLMDALNSDLVGEEDYDESSALHDLDYGVANEEGDEDKNDLVGSIRRKMKAKRG